MKKVCLILLLLCNTITIFAEVSSDDPNQSVCPSVSEIHKVEKVDHSWYVSGLLQYYDNNRYIVRIVGALYTLDGHKFSLWTEPFSAATEDEAKDAVKELLPTLSGPHPEPKNHFWKLHHCWYKFKDGTYVVARMWW